MVHVVDPLKEPVILAADTLACPDNSYAFDLAPGSYYRRVMLQGAFLGELPRVSMDANPVRLGGQAVTNDFRVEEGTEVLGGAFLDGAPFVGQGLGIEYAPPLLGIGALGSQSGADGGWVEGNGRIPPRLQRKATYEVTCPEAFGAIVTRGPVVETMHIASSKVHFDCELRTPSPATRFTHRSGQLIATAMPGDVGGISYDLSARFGFGWGVQYPIGPGEAPRGGSYSVAPIPSQLFRGGLIVAVAPNRTLFGFDTHGYPPELCPDRNVQCRGLGLDGRGRIEEWAGGGRVITWEYSDAGTGSGLGLAVRQRSFSALDGRDYVVFQFRFRNERHAAVTFYAGLWLDWDVGAATDNVGFTDLNGHLMYVTSAGGGVYLGTVTASDAPIGGNAVYQSSPYAHDSIYAWATGASHRWASDWPSDQRTIHTVGPITLDRRAKGDVWIAVVAGDDYQRVLDNAVAAQSAIAQLKAMPDLDE